MISVATGLHLNPPFAYNSNIGSLSTGPCDFRPHCFTCDFIAPQSEIISTITKQSFRIQTEMDCNSSNIIYMIQCDSCDIQYIGQTKRSLRHRFNNHRFDILNSRNTVIGIHFNQLRCSYEDCKITPVFQCPKLATEDLTTKKRIEIEQYFIGLFKTYQPHGLNLTHTNYKDSPKIHFIVPFSNLATKASQIVRQNYHDLQNKMPNVFSETLITAYKRNPNFGDMLVSSQMS